MSVILSRRSMLKFGRLPELVGAGLLTAPGLSLAAEAGKKLKIALSNSYIGNKWRIEMENCFKAALQMEPYKSEVEGTWFNSGNDVSAQSQQLSDLIGRARRRDPGRCGLADRAQRHRQTGHRSRHPRRLFRQHRHRAKRAEGQHRPVRVRRSCAEWLAKKHRRQGQRHHGDRRRRHLMSTSDRNEGADEVWAKEPGHQGRQPLHRHVGLGHRRAQHLGRSCRRCRRSTASGARAARTACSRPSSPRTRTAAADGGRGGERLPQVHARLHGTRRLRASPSASRRSSRSFRSSLPAASSRRVSEEGRHDPLPVCHQRDREGRRDGVP